MRPDPREALQRAAAVPDRPPDLDRLYARGSRIARKRRLAAVTAPIVVFAVLVSTVMALRPTQEPPPGAAAAGLFDRLVVGWNVLPTPPSISDYMAGTWTGQRLLVWARAGWQPGETTGFVFDARTRSWRATAAFPLSSREWPTWAWTGRELLVWGGLTYEGGPPREYADGAAYDPATDVWRTLPKAPIDARSALSVWTGRELIVWGDQGGWESAARQVYDGAAYDPTRDAWRRIADAPVALAEGTVVWTGREMIVLGVATTPDGGVVTDHLVGAAYDPATDTWRRLPAPNLSPQPVTTAWDGFEVIAVTYAGPTAAYDPMGNAWRSLPPAPESGACSPQNPTVGGRLFISRCVSTATVDALGVYTYDRVGNRWTAVTLADPPVSSGLLVEAGSLLLLTGRTSPAGDNVMYVYRPPG
jgi:hypothetical protein